ncbi:MAG TPA: hypothetical protein VGQ57_11960 [Polyangiaceae bacterium]|jgi:hypothetical protein|nr:hypothetical protein [Polyangiaceae bacterium]
MPKCYLLAIGGGSSVDQQSNNVTLFNLVEQLNFPSQKFPPPGVLLPLEVHAYLRFDAFEVNQKFELRFVLVGDTGLETPTNVFAHRSPGVRYRTRTFGLPAPPAAGNYELRVEYRANADAPWVRDPAAWPLMVLEAEARPAVTH